MPYELFTAPDIMLPDGRIIARASIGSARGTLCRLACLVRLLSPLCAVGMCGYTG
jgi:hypothetical protein